jgi:hypothetical protein
LQNGGNVAGAVTFSNTANFTNTLTIDAAGSLVVDGTSEFNGTIFIDGGIDTNDATDQISLNNNTLIDVGAPTFVIGASPTDTRSVNVGYVKDAVDYAIANASGGGGGSPTAGGDFTGDIQFDADNVPALGLEWYASGTANVKHFIKTLPTGGNDHLTIGAGNAATVNDYVSFTHPLASDPNDVVLQILPSVVISTVPISTTTPIDDGHATTKLYVDDAIAAAAANDNDFVSSFEYVPLSNELRIELTNGTLFNVNATFINTLSNNVSFRPESVGAAVEGITVLADDNSIQDVEAALVKLDLNKAASQDALLTGIPRVEATIPILEVYDQSPSANDRVRVSDEYANEVRVGTILEIQNSAGAQDQTTYRVLTVTPVGISDLDVTLQEYDGSVPALTPTTSIQGYQDIMIDDGTSGTTSTAPDIDASLNYQIRVRVDGNATPVVVNMAGSSLATHADVTTQIGTGAGFSTSFVTNAFGDNEAIRLTSATVGSSSQIQIMEQDFLGQKYQMINKNASFIGTDPIGISVDGNYTLRIFTTALSPIPQIDVTVALTTTTTYDQLVVLLNAELLDEQMSARISAGPNDVIGDSQLMIYQLDTGDVVRIDLANSTLLTDTNAWGSSLDAVPISTPLLVNLGTFVRIRDEISASSESFRTCIMGTEATHIASIGYVDFAIRNARIDTTVPAVLPTDDIYTVPEYKIGFNELQVYHQGLLLIPGTHYQEVNNGATGNPATAGTFTQLSTSVQLLAALTKSTGDTLTFIVSGRDRSGIFED